MESSEDPSVPCAVFSRSLWVHSTELSPTACSVPNFIMVCHLSHITVDAVSKRVENEIVSNTFETASVFYSTDKDRKPLFSPQLKSILL